MSMRTLGVGNCFPAVIFLTLLVPSLRADVKVASIFANHMILQQDAPLPVWGAAEAGEQVTVTVGQDTATATTGADGRWRVTLSPLAETSTPLTFTVAGKNTLTFTDVLVGEVWFASGQSNMALTVKATKDAATDIPLANDAQLRVFHVTGNSTMEPSDSLSVGTWVLTTPDTVPMYAAVAYYFAKDLRAKLNRPVAIIQCAIGATQAEAWTPLDGLKKSPDLQKYVDSYDKVEATYPTLNAAFPAAMAAYRKDLDQWNQEVGVTFTPLMTDWKAAAEKAQAANEPAPPQPVPSRPMPPRPPSPMGGENTPSTLYNSLVAPVLPYAIRGVIWYQGEFNAATWDTYHSLLSTMITAWRDHWGQGNFPFLIVQLPRFHGGGNWPLLREAQSQTTALPNVNIATTIDLGDPNNLHPTDKADVGDRLALVARHTVYNEKDLVWTGPIYDSMKVEENNIRVSFTQTGSGLTIGSSPWVPPHSLAIPTTSLFGFSIADDQKHWYPAEAKIDGNTVLVSSSLAPHPVAVRYAWQSSPEANLYNNEGLAAAPFRTDDWADGRDTPSTPATPKVAPAPAPMPSTHAAPAAP